MTFKIRTGARQHFMKKRERRWLTPIEWKKLRKANRPKKYDYRIIMEYYGSVWCGSPSKTEPSHISFDSRKRLGHYGWDSDRQALHFYRSMKTHKTWRVFPWQWEWNAYGYGHKTVAEKNERFRINPRLRHFSSF